MNTLRLVIGILLLGAVEVVLAGLVIAAGVRGLEVLSERRRTRLAERLRVRRAREDAEWQIYRRTAVGFQQMLEAAREASGIEGGDAR